MIKDEELHSSIDYAEGQSVWDRYQLYSESSSEMFFDLPYIRDDSLNM